MKRHSEDIDQMAVRDVTSRLRTSNRILSLMPLPHVPRGEHFERTPSLLVHSVLPSRTCVL